MNPDEGAKTVRQECAELRASLAAQCGISLMLIEALQETLRETEEHYCDIIGARDAVFQSNVPPKVAAAYREELSRMERVIEKARAALSKATGVRAGGDTK